MPHYSLDKIIDAAKKQNIIYGGRKVNRDISNLGYTLNEVAQCITQLQSHHYQKTLEFSNENIKEIFDVYIIKFLICDEKQDTIYIKLRLLESGQIYIKLGSFHLSK